MLYKICPRQIFSCNGKMNHPAASSGVSTKDKIDFIVASEGVLGPSFAIKMAPSSFIFTTKITGGRCHHTTTHITNNPAGVN